ncbi:hypothetical protein NA56DRAFT_602060 [Hyaloscypha hepaticicola]|uniref:Uncharacterized protein n=1 Tax=Hyaloscypha hepaticicola TaxID=2082293 RepID=A0A2J6Q1K0_9HELO|nr:hypothetical protein NA56DRAFT_602060 [Hyaloscypha hepaticicola]
MAGFKTPGSMVGAYPEAKTEAEIDCMEWESNSEFHKSRVEIGGIKTGGSDEKIKKIAMNDACHSGEQHTEQADIARNDTAVPSDQPLPSSTDTEHMAKASQQNKEFIDSPINSKARLKRTAVDDDLSRTSKSESELHSALEAACDRAEKLKDSQRECDILQRQVLELQRELRDAHDFVFSLQPKREQITESEAAAEFKSLFRMIEDWVETNLEDEIHARSILKQRGLQPSRIRRFLTLVSLPGQEASSCPETDVYNVIAVILKFLCIEIFDKDFYCPVEEGAMGFLNSILMSMRNLEPRRDLSTWRRWRSETLTALAGRPEFAAQRKHQVNYLVTELTNILLIFIPRSDLQKLGPSVHSVIIEPALTLAHRLQLSVDKFSLSWTAFGGTRPEMRSIDPRDYSSFDCVNILQSGKAMKPQAVAAAGTIKYMLDLTPALIFEAVKANAFADPRVLNRARILVAATKEGDGQLVSLRNDSEEPTVVACLFEKVRKLNSSHK